VKLVKVDNCRQCWYFNHHAKYPACFGLGIRAVLPFQKLRDFEWDAVRATGRIPTWCPLPEEK